MGTRADFYVGRGEHSEWLGSVGYDGYPESIPNTIFDARKEEEFRTRVVEFLSQQESSTFPSDGWPWPWQSSHLTDFVYAFENIRVFASHFATEWFDPHEPVPNIDELPKVVIFPDMSKMKHRELFGPHSGIMAIRS
jgi:hypothetical protein